jgi:glycine C-acetyltransferase
MPSQRLNEVLSSRLVEMQRAGRLKGKETVIRGLVPGHAEKGPRYLIEGEDDKPYLRMNSNSYLGLSFREQVIAAEERAARTYGVGPGAVRFISGTWAPHVELEKRLASFHGRQAALLFSSAYAAMLGLLPPLITDRTAVLSDELNHNCIINAIALARPAEKRIYRHLDVAELERNLAAAANTCARAIIITDGIFSMRGDWAPLDRIVALARKYDGAFAENVLVVVDDSHGVGAFGQSGRGTEEYTGSAADVLLATLGKAFGVNGGYIVAEEIIVRYLRETAPTYVYSNPITAAEAAAACSAIALLEGAEGRRLLAHLRAMTERFKTGLVQLGFETLPGEHPIAPLIVRDTALTSALVEHLRRHGILATGLTYPVVPKGEDEIRFQINADHTPADIEAVLESLAAFAASNAR